MRSNPITTHDADARHHAGEDFDLVRRRTRSGPHGHEQASGLEAVKWMIGSVIDAAKTAGAKIGLCGQAPSDYPEFAAFLVECGIDSISVRTAS